jgi:hypothetical protein
LIKHVRNQISAVARGLLIPHGYTLAVGGTLAMMIGKRGYPGGFALWMFVAASNGTLVLLVAAGAQRRGEGGQPSGAIAYNFAPMAAMPVAALAGSRVGPDSVAFPCAGMIVTATYVVLVSAHVR